MPYCPSAFKQLIPAHKLLTHTLVIERQLHYLLQLRGPTTIHHTSVSLRDTGLKRSCRWHTHDWHVKGEWAKECCRFGSSCDRNLAIELTQAVRTGTHYCTIFYMPTLTLYFRMTWYHGMKQLVHNSGWRDITSWPKTCIEGCISRTISLLRQRPFRATRSSDWAFTRQVISSSSCSRGLQSSAKFCTHLEDVRWELHKRFANVSVYTSNIKKLQSQIGLLSSLQGWLHRLREPASPERKSWPSWMKMKRT